LQVSRQKLLPGFGDTLCTQYH